MVVGRLSLLSYFELYIHFVVGVYKTFFITGAWGQVGLQGRGYIMIHDLIH